MILPQPPTDVTVSGGKVIDFEDWIVNSIFPFVGLWTDRSGVWEVTTELLFAGTGRTTSLILWIYPADVDHFITFIAGYISREEFMLFMQSRMSWTVSIKDGPFEVRAACVQVTFNLVVMVSHSHGGKLVVQHSLKIYSYQNDDYRSFMTIYDYMSSIDVLDIVFSTQPVSTVY